jgi:hypothetical protein
MRRALMHAIVPGTALVMTLVMRLTKVPLQPVLTLKYRR